MSKAYDEVAAAANKTDQSMKKYSKFIRTVSGIGAVLGGLVNPYQAEENAYRLGRKMRLRK